ncbi:MAG: SsrA-binding protein SmpB [Tenericutes bacterium]|jgi:SsrA-binding protein|nr:SsrA-binding protein SmpB [Mycoplasmatota bacterium]
MEILNRKARYNYFIEEEYECGISLKGTEVKSIRKGTANIKDSYAIVKNNEIILLNMYISHYNKGNIFNHEETRNRRLLLHKKEIKKISSKIELEGYTLIPLKIYFVRNKVKVLLGLCKGKKTYDKRETIKARDLKRDIEKTIKER